MIIQETVDWIGQIPGDLLHEIVAKGPRASRQKVAQGTAVQSIKSVMGA
jgi:hypothetical protein